MVGVQTAVDQSRECFGGKFEVGRGAGVARCEVDGIRGERDTECSGRIRCGDDDGAVRSGWLAGEAGDQSEIADDEIGRASCRERVCLLV